MARYNVEEPQAGRTTNRTGNQGWVVRRRSDDYPCIQGGDLAAVGGEERPEEGTNGMLSRTSLTKTNRGCQGPDTTRREDWGGD